MQFITNEEFEIAIKTSLTKTEAMNQLGIKPYFRHYQLMNERIKRQSLDTQHFVGSAHGKAKPGPKLDLKEYLCENGPRIGGARLKQRLIKESLLENKCNQCGINEWQKQQLSLHLDHINGRPTDNRLENLRLLCPNCHSLTSTYCGKNNSGRKKWITHCLDCGKELKYKRSKRCVSCANIVNLEKHRAAKWPPFEDLKEMVKASNYCAVARKLGVSDNAVRKHIKVRENQLARANHPSVVK
jgi:Zn finger protein HypA/HybF involved in hydrogenase expression